MDRPTSVGYCLYSRRNAMKSNAIHALPNCMLVHSCRSTNTVDQQCPKSAYLLYSGKVAKYARNKIQSFEKHLQLPSFSEFVNKIYSFNLDYVQSYQFTIVSHKPVFILLICL